MPEENLFEEGNLLYTNEYVYEDGGTPTCKFMIVVATKDGATLIVRALPTSKDKLSIPGYKQKHGFNNSGNKSFYLFAEKVPVGEDGFSFNVDTYVYFNQNLMVVDTLDFLKNGMEFRKITKLKQTEYLNFVQSVLTSIHTPQKVIKFINGI